MKLPIAYYTTGYDIIPIWILLVISQSIIHKKVQEGYCLKLLYLILKNDSAQVLKQVHGHADFSKMVIVSFDWKSFFSFYILYTCEIKQVWNHLGTKMYPQTDKRFGDQIWKTIFYVVGSFVFCSVIKWTYYV